MTAFPSTKKDRLLSPASVSEHAAAFETEELCLKLPRSLSRWDPGLSHVWLRRTPRRPPLRRRLRALQEGIREVQEMGTYLPRKPRSTLHKSTHRRLPARPLQSDSPVDTTSATTTHLHLRRGWLSSKGPSSSPSCFGVPSCRLPVASMSAVPSRTWEDSSSGQITRADLCGSMAMAKCRSKKVCLYLAEVLMPHTGSLAFSKGSVRLRSRRKTFS